MIICWKGILRRNKSGRERPLFWFIHIDFKMPKMIHQVDCWAFKSGTKHRAHDFCHFLLSRCGTFATNLFCIIIKMSSHPIKARNGNMKGIVLWTVQSLSCVRLLATLWTVAHQVPLSGISQARILEWVAISFSGGSSRPRDQTHVFCLAGGFFMTELPGKAKRYYNQEQNS